MVIFEESNLVTLTLKTANQTVCVTFLLTPELVTRVLSLVILKI